MLGSLFSRDSSGQPCHALAGHYYREIPDVSADRHATFLASLSEAYRH